MNDMVKNKSLDPHIVGTILENFADFVKTCMRAGEQAVKEYGMLHDIGMTERGI